MARAVPSKILDGSIRGKGYVKKKHSKSGNRVAILSVTFSMSISSIVSVAKE